MGKTDVSIPPSFCQYTSGHCDQSFVGLEQNRTFCMYPNDPKNIAQTVESAIEKIRQYRKQSKVIGWKDLSTTGRIIFCEICKAIRSSEFAAADITTLNFNVLFEIGYALGLGKPVMTLRDTTFIRDKKIYTELGLLDTVGWEDFQNSDNIVSHLSGKVPAYPFSEQFLSKQPSSQPTIYFIKSPINSEHSIRLASSLNRSAFRIKMFDVQETTRLSTQEALRQVASAIGVIAHLIDPNRQGAEVHNARCAFVAGVGMAMMKPVLMLQEGEFQAPIDYRDVVVACKDASEVQHCATTFIRQVSQHLEASTKTTVRVNQRLLARIDLGDPSAENETDALKSYFVDTAEFSQVARGRTRLVVGRKGTGKTAIFFRLKDEFWKKKDFVVDLRPESHQFLELKELVVKNLTAGVQEHTLTAFWNYLLLMEIAFAIIDKDKDTDRDSSPQYMEVLKQYKQHAPADERDFSERLLRLTERIASRFRAADAAIMGQATVTQLIYSSDIRPLSNAILKYLDSREHIWLLFDNIDKGWTTRGATPEDITLVRCLLAAMRRVQSLFDSKKLAFHGVVFLRKDIYEQLVDQTADRGKDTTVALHWSDAEQFKDLLLRRINESFATNEPFHALWAKLFDPHVGGTESFRYILERTLSRPRDLLNFVRKAIDIAINRNKDKVDEKDILEAERSFSRDMLQDLFYEIRDVQPSFTDILAKFTNCSVILDADDLSLLLMEKLDDDKKVEKLVDALLWFSFLGVMLPDGREAYSYQADYDLAQLKRGGGAKPRYVIHPAFRIALGCK